jgi:hypothetical protein
MKAVALILAGFVHGENGTIPVTFRADNLTPAECQKSLQSLPQSIRESWGQRITFTRKECR